MKLERLEIAGFLHFTEPAVLDLREIPHGLVAIVGQNGCLVGDSLIDLPRDLRRHPKGVPIRDLVGTQPLVYGYDGSKIALAKAVRVWKTGTKEVVRVRFTSSKHGMFKPPKELIGTADHLIMLRDGTYKALGTLAAGDSLMPLYRRCRDGDYVWINMNDGTFALEHRLVAAFKIGRDLTADEHGHHIDKNTFNNTLENIDMMSASAHSALHAASHPPTYDVHPRGMLGKHHREEIKAQIGDTWRRKNAADPSIHARATETARVRRAENPKPYHDRELLRRLYIDERIGAEEIGERFDVSDACISYWLKRYGIPIRSFSEVQKAAASRRQTALVCNHCVVSVEPAGIEDVFDMEVPTLNNFVANGVVVHNSGKSRLLDSALGSLYGPGVINNAFPSREGSLAEYATSRDAYIETLWEVDEGHYRARVNVDGVRRNTDAVLETVIGTLRAPLNDGKTSTFREEVARRFPSKRQVLASAFASQNKSGSFVALDQKGRMELFAELCDLGHYAEKAEAAKRCVTAVEKARAALLAAQDVLAREAGADVAQALDSRRLELSLAADLARDEWRSLTTKIDALEAERETCAAQASQNVVAEARLREIDGKIDALKAEQDRLVADTIRANSEADSERSKADQQMRKTHAELLARADSIVSTHTKTVADLLERITNNQTILAQADEIRAAAKAKHTAEDRLVELRADETARQARVDGFLAVRADADRAVTEAKQVIVELDRARRQADALTSVPCGGSGEYASCRFLTDATAAAALIPALTEKDAAAVDIGLRAVDAQKALDAAKDALTDVKKQIAALTVEIATHVKAKLEPHLAAAEEKVAGYQREQVKAEADRVTRLTELDEQRLRANEAHADAIAALEDRLGHRLEEIQARQVAVTQELETQVSARQEAAGAAEATRDARKALDAADASLRAARQAQTAQSQAQARAEAGLEDVGRQQAALDAKRADLAGVQERLKTADSELLVWQMLAKAFGRDGLPKLEVDAAGPTVSNFANDLLMSCYGARFSLELTTQVANATGGLKERFAIIITDNQYGGEPRDIADLSGGERVIVEEALRCAIALLVNSRNKSRVLTVFRDEACGGLDTDNAIRYMSMLRRLHQLGGLAHILMVTHNLDVAAMADCQVRVSNGQPTVVFPPYEDVA